jgi:hypothetical protein
MQEKNSEPEFSLELLPEKTSDTELMWSVPLQLSACAGVYLLMDFFVLRFEGST